MSPHEFTITGLSVEEAKRWCAANLVGFARVKEPPQWERWREDGAGNLITVPTCIIAADHDDDLVLIHLRWGGNNMTVVKKRLPRGRRRGKHRDK